MNDVIFVVFAVMSIASALAVVTWRNPIYCVLALIVSFAGIAGLFYILTAPFIAAMQIVVYAGAIIVLFLFVIMLLNLKKEEMGGEMKLSFRILAMFWCFIMIVCVGIPVIKTFPGASDKSRLPAADTAFGTTETIGREIFASHVLPFELISILIIAALVGAIYLARKKNRG